MKTIVTNSITNHINKCVKAMLSFSVFAIPFNDFSDCNNGALIFGLTFSKKKNLFLGDVKIACLFTYVRFC